MKRFLVLTALMVFSGSIFSYAQTGTNPLTGDDRTFAGGISAGANVSEVLGDAYHGYHKAGWNVGAVVFAQLSSSLSASLEILYSQKGSRGVHEVNSQYVGASFERYFLDLNYIEVPVQLHYKIPYKKPLLAGAGLSYSRLLNSKEEVLTDQPVYIKPEDHRFKEADLCWVLSASYRFYTGWLISLRYQRSLRPIRGFEMVPLNLGSGDQLNTYFSLKLIYLFH